MRKKPPTLADLPDPPSDRHGWPWTQPAPTLPPLTPGGGPWPRISIVTPSFNQGRWLEECIRSVLLQGYPDLEYHVVDGGSTDETIEILERYEPWLDSWTSRADDGQSDAINQGFARTNGEVFNWLCSDDFLAAGALEQVGSALADPDCDVLSGACLCLHEDDPIRTGVRPSKGPAWLRTPYAAGIWQPSTFWRPRLLKRRNPVLRDLHFCMDRELWCHLTSSGARWRWSDDSLSTYRFTGQNKSVVGRCRLIAEIARIYSDHRRQWLPLPTVLRRVWLPLVLAARHPRTGLRKRTAHAASRTVAAATLLCYRRHDVRCLQREFHSHSVW